MALADVKLQFTWDKNQILKYICELFQQYLSVESEIEILVPESGTLIKIVERRLLQNRKATYVRPFEGIATSSEIDLDASTAVSGATAAKQKNLFLRFSRSTRTSNLELYMNSIFITSDLFFALNQPNYAR